MTNSMTAFARTEASTDWGDLVWEIRSVNHRYLESVFRMPEEFRLLETRCREIIGTNLGRGKLDCQLRFQRTAGGTTGLELDENLLGQVLDLVQRVRSRLGESPEPDAIRILRWPGVVREPELEMETVSRAVVETFAQAVEQLGEMRATEGARLAEILRDRSETMSGIVQQVRKHRPRVIEAIRDKLEQRLKDLVEKPDYDRLEQELVFQAQRLDVDEELVRLDSHLAEIREVLKRNGPIGRRLDFLMQELNREANTLGSKSADVETTKASVDLKVLIEQMREQVQNIE